MQLTFYCELEEAPLVELFEQSSVIETLQKLGAGVSLGIMDLSDARADVVTRLNEAGIPVTAWLLLPVEQGYWFNINNAVQASDRYSAFVKWTAGHDLKWQSVGLDIEPDRREIEAMMQDRATIVPTLFNRVLDTGKLAQATQDYNHLVRHIRQDGYSVDSYHIPVVVDERHSGSTLLQRLGGLIDVEVDREVLMLYTSFMGQAGSGLLWLYASEAQSVGVGSTGGGVDIGNARQMILTWNELARDLRLAAQWTQDIHIFSLEGCVHNGYLEKLIDFDWSIHEVPSSEALRQAQWMRWGLRAVLWTGVNWRPIGGTLFGLWLLRRRRNRK